MDLTFGFAFASPCVGKQSFNSKEVGSLIVDKDVAIIPSTFFEADRILLLRCLKRNGIVDWLRAMERVVFAWTLKSDPPAGDYLRFAWFD